MTDQTAPRPDRPTPSPSTAFIAATQSTTWPSPRSVSSPRSIQEWNGVGRCSPMWNPGTALRMPEWNAMPCFTKLKRCGAAFIAGLAWGLGVLPLPV